MPPHNHFPSKCLVSPEKSSTFAPTNPTTLLVARPADQGGTFLLYMEYTKQPITLAEQINILKQRGLTFEDENAALRILSQISYFRLARRIAAYIAFVAAVISLPSCRCTLSIPNSVRSYSMRCNTLRLHQGRRLTSTLP